LAILVLVLAQSPSNAQSNLSVEDLCPYYREIDPLLDCLQIDSYGQLGEILENAPSGSDITLCPFFVRKVTSIDPIIVKSGVRVTCARTTPDEFCTIIGLGNHLIIDTAQDTMWQGFSFRGSNDHAVLIAGDVDNAELATHTFCQTSFLDNVRAKDTRGGAMMLEKSSGTINVVECFFQENFTKTFGAGIYSRAQQLNVIQSLFVRNQSNGYGPALFTAVGGSLMLKNSRFLSNEGREGHDIVFNPSDDGATYFEDGFENSISGGGCRGVYNMATNSCIDFIKFSPSPMPTPPPTNIPTSKPTNIPTQMPTKKPTQEPTIKVTVPPSYFPTIRPTHVQTSKPTLIPTKSPTLSPSLRAVVVPTQVRENQASIKPSVMKISTPVSTKKPSQNPTGSPVLSAFNSDLMVTIDPPNPGSSGEAFGEMISKKCFFRVLHDDTECVDVTSFQEFKLAIEKSSRDVILCGGFNFRKTGQEAVHISSDTDIRCVEKCSFYGVGPFLHVEGESKIRIKNLKFFNSQDTSAVIVSTTSSGSQTTFCDIEFSRNQVSIGNDDIGGALTIESRSGVVNIVNNTFTGNIASRGGAILSNGFKLNIFGSKFVANNAYNSGNAIFVGDGNHLSIQSSTFILNTEVSTRSSARGGHDSNKGVAILVQPNKSIRVGSASGIVSDGGSNEVILSGDCAGVYFSSQDQCETFK